MTYEGRRVAVTGATGFIGSHLVESLVRSGASVRALANYNSRGSIGALRWIEPQLRACVDLHFGDIRDQRLVREFVSGAEVVFHLAAVISVPYSYISPRLVFDVNVGGTMNIMEAARDAGTARVVHTSTSEVYGTPDNLPITERHPLKGQSPYAASKIGADKLCESFHCSYGLPVVTLRPFNTYGPRQSTRAIIPTIVSQALRGDGTIRLGSLDPVRDLVFVHDTASGFLAAGTATGVEGETIQLSTGRGIDIASLVREVENVVGRPLEVVQEPERVRPVGSEVMRLVGDSSKGEKMLGWRPTCSLTQGLESVVEWVRKMDESGGEAGRRYV